MKKNPSYLASSLAGMIACCPAYPVDASEKSAPIIVTATRDQKNTGTQIIDSGQIRQSPARTLPELLSFEAGIFSRSLYGNNATRATIDIRGFGATAAQNTLILVDGRRLNDVDLAAVEFSTIPLANIERVVTGQWAAPSISLPNSPAHLAAQARWNLRPEITVHVA
jgi:iron complex outermembrane receptor protein